MRIFVHICGLDGDCLLVIDEEGRYEDIEGRRRYHMGFDRQYTDCGDEVRLCRVGKRGDVERGSAFGGRFSE
jgi:hypothetical protein